MEKPSRDMKTVLFLALAVIVPAWLFEGFLAGTFGRMDLVVLRILHQAAWPDLLLDPDLIHRASGALPNFLLALELRLFSGSFVLYQAVLFLLHLACLALLYQSAKPLAGRVGAAVAVVLMAWSPIMPFFFASPVQGLAQGSRLFCLLLCLVCFARHQNLASAFFMALATACRGTAALPLVVLFYDLALPQKTRLLRHLPLWIVFFLVQSILDDGSLFSIDPLAALLYATFPWAVNLLGILVLVNAIWGLGSIPLSYLPVLLLPIAAVYTVCDPNALYLPWAFFCLSMGMLARSLLEQKHWIRWATVAAITLLVLYHGSISRTRTDALIERAERLTALKAQVPGFLAADRSPSAPVFLLDLPQEMVPDLSLCFAPPFSDQDLKVYPLLRTACLNPELDTPFLLAMWGEGTALRYDPEAGRLVSIHEGGVDRSYLIEYFSRYSQGKRRALMPVSMPVNGMCVRMVDKAFPVTFPGRKAAAYRVVLLTRFAPAVLEKIGFTRDMMVVEDYNPVEGVLEKWDITLYFTEDLLQDALPCFSGEPVFMWVELLADDGSVEHRSPLIRFNLVSAKG